MSPYQKPVTYWIAAIAGLVLALLGDGWLDAIGLTLLAAPIVRLGYAARRSPRAIR